MTEEARLHFERAAHLFDLAERLASTDPSDSVSRSYYAMFHAAKAVLETVGLERKSHHAVWAAFGEHLAARGLVDSSLHRSALDAFEARCDSDYLPQPLDTPADARHQLGRAREFLAACRSFLDSMDRDKSKP